MSRIQQELTSAPANFEREEIEGIDVEFQLAKKIVIIPLNYGFMVEVGCQTLAVENLGTLISNLNMYLQNPKKYEDNWNINRKLM